MLTLKPKCGHLVWIKDFDFTQLHVKHALTWELSTAHIPDGWIEIRAWGHLATVLTEGFLQLCKLVCGHKSHLRHMNAGSVRGWRHQLGNWLTAALQLLAEEVLWSLDVRNHSTELVTHTQAQHFGDQGVSVYHGLTLGGHSSKVLRSTCQEAERCILDHRGNQSSDKVTREPKTLELL